MSSWARRRKGAASASTCGPRWKPADARRSTWWFCTCPVRVGTWRRFSTRHVSSSRVGTRCQRARQGAHCASSLCGAYPSSSAMARVECSSSAERPTRASSVVPRAGMTRVTTSGSDSPSVNTGATSEVTPVRPCSPATVQRKRLNHRRSSAGRYGRYCWCSYPPNSVKATVTLPGHVPTDRSADPLPGVAGLPPDTKVTTTKLNLDTAWLRPGSGLRGSAEAQPGFGEVVRRDWPPGH